jgi:mono/diheme cytochrome c family protein
MYQHPSTIIALAILLACVLGGRVWSADSMQEAALGAKVFAENCSRCHEAPDPASRDGRAWRAITMHMRVFADISREEQQQVLRFLRTYNTVEMTRQAGAPASR